MTDCKFEAGKTYPLRGGGTAEILKVEAKLKVSGSIILGLINKPDGFQSVCAWHLDGRAFKDGETDLDLMPPEPKRESEWLNMYPKSSNIEQIVCNSRDNADFIALATRTHVLEIVYEDGVFVKSIAHKV